MDERRHPQVVNLDEIDAREESRGSFGFRSRRLGSAAHGAALGCSHFEVPPGKTAVPFHFHANAEEALYILEGVGRLRLGESTIELRAGDYIAFPPGPDFAHALSNCGDAPLRYLALSSPAASTTAVDICVYPDSKKIAYGGAPDGITNWHQQAWVRGRHKLQPGCDYYLDEPLAKQDDDRTPRLGTLPLHFLAGIARRGSSAALPSGGARDPGLEVSWGTLAYLCGLLEELLDLDFDALPSRTRILDAPPTRARTNDAARRMPVRRLLGWPGHRE